MAVMNGDNMSAIAGMGATTSTTKTDTAATASAMGSLGPDAFMKLLVAQMKYQNPFSPSDPTAMLSQVATYSQVEMLQKLSSTASSSAALQQANMAADVIGKSVTATGSDGRDITGVVTSTRFTADGPVLVLDGSTEVPLAAVTGVGISPNAATPAISVTPVTPAATTPVPAATVASDAPAYADPSTTSTSTTA
jgi:flagellar basal-body rod modification protein FlgD